MADPPTRRPTAPTKRASTALPRPVSLAIDPSAIIAQHATLTGAHPITVGPLAVLHPYCKVASTAAPVVLGQGCVVFERAVVGVGAAGAGAGGLMGLGRREEGRASGVMLGRNVVVETGAVVEAAEVGEGTVVEAGARLGVGAVVGKFCTITAATVIPPNSHLPDYTVVYGVSERRVDTTMQARPDLRETKMLMHGKQIDVFRKLIPNNVAKYQ